MLVFKSHFDSDFVSASAVILYIVEICSISEHGAALMSMAAEKNRVKYRSSSVPGLNVDAGEKEASLNTTTAGQGHDHKNQVVPHCKPREDHYCIYNPDFRAYL